MENKTFFVTGLFPDWAGKSFFPARVTVSNGQIESVNRGGAEIEGPLPYILPGFIDAHVHIESSMLIPSEFARMAVAHGTVATVSDPHEIANVCGIHGVEFMINNGKKVPFKFNFGAPSCVPATSFETAGDAIDVRAVSALLQRDDVRYLSEMMNFPGVLFNDPDVMQKIAAAKSLNKPIDGHAPGLMGEKAQQYIDAGISTDHECFTYEEALDKLRRGMKVIIREGSAAKNFEALYSLLHEWYGQMMFCSDDKHPDNLEEGHINRLCARAVEKGVDVFKVLQAACINPVNHYKLDVGILNPGEPADFILVEDLIGFRVIKTFINGQLVAENGKGLIERVVDPEAGKMNRFSCSPVSQEVFKVISSGKDTVPVIEALDGQLITQKWLWQPLIRDGRIVQDTENDILKIAVINRYHPAPVAVAFIKNIGLKKGAIASSVAHDSHNIVVIGCSDECMMRAANLVIAEKGGVSATDGLEDKVLGLPVAGLMSAEDGHEVASAYTAIDQFARINLGSTLQSPFMTLSFMALLVIPKLKLSDRGLFDGESFSFVPGWEIQE
ncbi:MAG: adenine deaminase [Chitinophagaceae bacterium]|jgi:adenine deaminase|nr:adenine deaminase [Chitinophagaceae bacterium]